MNKTLLIIKREYLTRVRKRSFILLTLIGPLIMAGVIIAAVWLGLQDAGQQKILVVDDNYPLFENIESSGQISFDVQKITLGQAMALLEASDHTAILYLPKNILSSKTGRLYFKRAPSIRSQRDIENKVQEVIELEKIKELEITELDYRRLKAPFKLGTFKYKSATESEKVDNLPRIVGLIFSVLIYLFIFMYSVQVMRGVIEEKTSRIIEILISSVKPFQLMMGKIVGIALVGLTQFILWIILTLTIASVGQAIIIGDKYKAEIVASQMSEEMRQEIASDSTDEMISLSGEDSLLQKIQRINFPLMLGVFLFYFLGGYLLYSAMMAAVGSAVDNETDTQQFMLPITFPLLLAYMVSFIIFDNPESPVAVWMSIIPFTSPVVMMIRVSIGIESGDLWQLALSMALLVLTFVFITWLAGKIYRTGILMYGKKPSVKEIFKWLKY